jgi:small-conductance mechanosensitive channel
VAANNGGVLMGNCSVKEKHFFRFALYPAVMMVVAVSLLSAVPGSAADSKVQVFANATTVAATTGIPLAEVALRATEVADALRSSAGSTAVTAGIESIRRSLPLFSAEVGTQFRETTLLLKGYSTLSGLQAQQQLWQQKIARAKAWLQALTARARQLDVFLGKLEGRQKVWTKTLEVAKASDAPDAILLQIETTLDVLGAAITRLHQQQSTVLDLQIRLVQDLSVCGNAIDDIARAQQSVVKGTFLPDSLPLWDAQQWWRSQEELPAYFRVFVSTVIAELHQYASDSRWMLALIFYAALFYLFIVARKRYRQWETIDDTRMFASEVYEHPYCAALTVILLALTSPWSVVPVHSKAFLQAVSIVPMVLLVRPSVHSRIFSWICALSILFAIETVRQAFSGVMSVGQAILAFESFVALAVIGWMMTRKGQPLPPSAIIPALRVEFARLISYALLVGFAVSLVAAVTGYMNLARLLAPSILVGGYLGLGLYAALRVSSAAFGFLLHVWPINQFRMVQHCRVVLEQHFYLVLVWGAILGWITRFLYYMGLLEPASSAVDTILGAKYERGAIAISVSDLLAFFLTVWITFLLSRFIRFVLQEEVYPRIHVAPGRAYAASSLLHYFILAFGFIVAIGLMGVDLAKVTVLAGALGVGIGFGLQSVVNNFVSGLILLFERPVSAGDTIEVGELLGEVRRIGMRSSTVRTWKGADIIVPNSQLISEKVTNWTLSDRRRRIDIPVGVNYGADPKKVMLLIEEVAASHPDILGKPSPQPLFLGYGDSSINFELRAWTDKFDDWTRIKSDLVVAIYDAVSKEADVTFPFPQRDVHLIHDFGAGSAAVNAPVNDDTGGRETKAYKSFKG